MGRLTLDNVRFGPGIEISPGFGDASASASELRRVPSTGSPAAWAWASTSATGASVGWRFHAPAIATRGLVAALSVSLPLRVWLAAWASAAAGRALRSRTASSRPPRATPLRHRGAWPGAWTPRPRPWRGRPAASRTRARRPASPLRPAACWSVSDVPRGGRSRRPLPTRAHSPRPSAARADGGLLDDRRGRRPGVGVDGRPKLGFVVMRDRAAHLARADELEQPEVMQRAHVVADRSQRRVKPLGQLARRWRALLQQREDPHPKRVTERFDVALVA